MFHLLYKYFVLYDYVNIPGVGHFSVERHPAKIDVDNNIIHAPESTIKYKNETDVADKGVYSFLAEELNIDVVEAIRQFQDFSHELKNNVTSKKLVALPAFGSLELVGDQFAFSGDTDTQTYYPAISTEKALEYKEMLSDEDQQASEELLEHEEETATRSYWWLYALILTLLGAGAIAYYYFYEQGYRF
jgi:nucleoid DNA-binding protein